MTDVIAPLAFVAAEVRVSYTPALVTDVVIAALSKQLPALPVPRKEQRQTVIIGAAPTPLEVAVRLTSVDGMTSLTVSATTLTLETTSYQGIDAFSGLFSQCMEAVAEAAAPSFVERIGLRYVNELRVAEPITAIEQWGTYVCSEVMAPAHVGGTALQSAGVEGATVNSLQTLVTFDVPPQRAITARFLPLVGPPAVGNEPLMRPQMPAEGPYFIVDLDAYWPSTQRPPEMFMPGELSRTVSELHVPVEAMFLWATTTKFREGAL